MTQQTVDTGLAVVNDNNISDVNIGTLKTKQLGLSIVLMGLAENQASRIQKLSKVVDKLEEQLFDAEKIDHLSADEKIERYQLALSSIGTASNYIKSTVNTVDWTTLEVQLLAIANSSLNDENGAKAGVSGDLKDMAAKLLNELGSDIASKS